MAVKHIPGNSKAQDKAAAQKAKQKQSGAKGILANKPPKQMGGVKQLNSKYTGLNNAQNFAINQRQQADISLGNMANQQLDQIYGNFSQPFDWNSLPQAPGPQDFSQVPGAPGGSDYNRWVDEQVQLENKAFDSRNDPIFAKQAENFRQRMANQGIPEDSPAYAAAYKAEIADPQADARNQAYATARRGASANAGQFADVGFQAHNTGIADQQTFYNAGNQYYNDAYTRSMAQRNQPLNDFNQLYGSTSPFATQNLAFSQGLDTSNNAAQNAMRAAAAGRGGGGGGGRGGGGGGGPTPFDPNLDPATQRWLFQQQYLAANPVSQPKGPSYGAQLFGNIAGSAISGFAQGYGQSYGAS